MDLATLAHPDRQRAVAALGRAAATDPDARATLAELATHSDAWRRWLAVLGHAAAGDDDALIAALDDPARSVRNRAWSALASQGGAASLAAALATQGHSRVAAHRAGQEQERRPSPELEAVILGFADREHPAWLDRLASCSEAAVRARLTLLEEAGSSAAWRRLGRRHPGLLRDHLVAALRGRRTLDTRLHWRILDTMSPLVEADPDAALDVVTACFDLASPPHPLRTWLARLASLRPARTFDALRARQALGLPAPAPGLFSMVDFPNAAALGLERLKWAVARAPSCLPEGGEGRLWLGRLPPEDCAALLDHWLDHGISAWGAFLFASVDPADPRREPAFARWVRAACDKEGVVSVDRLDGLPRDLREREARRHLHAIPWLDARPQLRRVYAKLLGWDEAERELDSWLKHPEGAERGVALGLLLSTVRHDGEAAPKALAAVRRRKNEQDPVRLAMLQGLVALPPSRLHGHTGELVAIVGEALDAADLSGMTAQAAQRIAAIVVVADPAGGLALLTRVLQVRGSIDGALIGERLLPKDAARLDPVLAPLAADWVRRERAMHALGLLRGLDKRLKHMPRTLDAVDALCGIPSLGVLAALLEILKEHDRKRFAARAMELFQADASAVCLPSIAAHLATARTDLLDPLLSGQPMTGRWATGRTHWILDFGLQLGGWTSAQQARYAAGLVGLVDTPERDVPTCRWAIDRLAALTWAPSAPLVRFSADKRIPVRDLAIRALPALDDGAGLPGLLDCMGDDRARIATYALRGILREMAPAQVLAQLASVPMDRVTVAKEVLRLMGELGGPAARDPLLKIGQGKLHRDVRIALLRALWDHIEHPDAWALLEAAATDADAILAGRLLSIPLDRLSAAADARLATLFAALLTRPESEARLGFLAEVGTAPLRDNARVLFAALVRHLATPDPTEAAAALGAVLTRMREDEVPLVVARLAGLLPTRRHALALVDRLVVSTSKWSPPAHRALAVALLAPLSADRLAATPAIRLATRCRDDDGLFDLLVTLDGRGHLHHDAVAAAIDAVKGASSPTSLAHRLAASPSPRLRRIGLAALVVAAGPGNGWTPERRELLATFQADPSVEVAGPAAWVFPPVGDPAGKG